MGDITIARRPFIPMKKLESNLLGASLRSITDASENMAAEVNVSTSPKTELFTAVAVILLGFCIETSKQPKKLERAAPKEHHLKGSRQITNEKKKVKTDVVEERTVLVATEV
mmetsp:Transcript_88357/g.153028  ORF Transcript_88357/g.153028 Transcript_88357/m.153028 type:complete len:112 (+) Transcript_88357:504-839(+)